jgi:hypothetical protein
MKALDERHSPRRTSRNDRDVFRNSWNRVSALPLMTSPPMRML